ncbi:DUF6000 family protein [Streptomyces sp. NPDC088353]|uniref:DUF6000 family protein n=1 Tax=unclassified Streptomyces TaxID=2593676 RepID=UPI00369DF129
MPASLYGAPHSVGLGLRSVTGAPLEFMLQPNWRSRTTAAWMIGLDHRERFVWQGAGGGAAAREALSQRGGIHAP